MKTSSINIACEIIVHCIYIEWFEIKSHLDDVLRTIFNLPFRLFMKKQKRMILVSFCGNVSVFYIWINFNNTKKCIKRILQHCSYDVSRNFRWKHSIIIHVEASHLWISENNLKVFLNIFEMYSNRWIH